MSMESPDICWTTAWILQAWTGEDESNGTFHIDPPVVTTFLDACAVVFGPTMDNYRLPLAQRGTRGMQWVVCVYVYELHSL